MVIGIRRADKNEWEKRVPLIPKDIEYLNKKYGIKTLIQPSKIRAFSDEQYSIAGAEVIEDINEADTIFAVKEIPLDFYRKDKTYLFFSHTIKGQEYNMPLLKRMMELRCNLIDYERIVDESNRRIIFFGKYAGIAGMIETIHALGQKLKLKGFKTPFEIIKQAYKYDSIEEAKQALKEVGDLVRKDGLPEKLQPIVIGFAGYGNVSQGAQEIYDILPVKNIKPEDVPKIEQFTREKKATILYKVIFKEEDLVKAKQGIFELQDYYDNPEKYVGNFEQYVPYLTALVNCIYWTEKYPRLVSKEFLKSSSYSNSRKKLFVIGDISCDIGGSIEITNKATEPGDANYTYFPDIDDYKDGVVKNGITIMAVDNLPCEFPIESSKEFSSALKNYVYEIVTSDFNQPFEELSLSYSIKKALILHRGELTKEYLYLNKYLVKE